MSWEVYTGTAFTQSSFLRPAKQKQGFTDSLSIVSGWPPNFPGHYQLIRMLLDPQSKMADHLSLILDFTYIFSLIIFLLLVKIM